MVSSYVYGLNQASAAIVVELFEYIETYSVSSFTTENPSLLVSSTDTCPYTCCVGFGFDTEQSASAVGTSR